MPIKIELLKADPLLSFLVFGALIYVVLLMLVLIYHIFKGFFR
ncbi:hypothetical protein [Gracilibacillus suaedae]|nr:hypothetical protein [Gracilibacillus suaedae]